MTTPLVDPVTRRTGLTVDGREVEVTLVPGSIDTATPESISFHLVGLHADKDRSIPFPYLLRLAGYASVKLPKLAKGEERLNPAEEIKRLFEQNPGLADRINRIKGARGSEGELV